MSVITCYASDLCLGDTYYAEHADIFRGFPQALQENCSLLQFTIHPLILSTTSTYRN